ncbi:hypothetical protein C3L33_12314, partial [Rhododendron williamsianum]
MREEEAKEKENKEAFELSVTLFQTIVIVAALIATITFAAAFTIPGGYDGNPGRDQGMAILARESAFKTFVIINTIAMVCSVTSIFLCLFAMGYSLISPEEEALEYYTNRYCGAVCLIIVSMFFLMIAFIAATFAVLAHAIALAVSTLFGLCGRVIDGPRVDCEGHRWLGIVGLGYRQFELCDLVYHRLLALDLCGSVIDGRKVDCEDRQRLGIVGLGFQQFGFCDLVYRFVIG